jgi:hypothetical protein
MTEILLKVALNIIEQTNKHSEFPGEKFEIIKGNQKS